MAPQTEIRVALIGAGYAGQAHAFGYRNAGMADRLAHVRVVLDTVVDPNLELAESVARRYGFAKVTANIDDILQDPEITAVSVALPNFAYREVLEKLLRAGKHVFTEKPLGRTGTEASELAVLAEEAGTVSGVGFSFRRVPALAAIQALARHGDIGTPYFARASYYADYALDPRSPRTWRFDQELSGGGALIDIGMHAIDALIATLGPIDEVTAVLSTVITERPLPAGGIGHAARASDTETGPVTNDDTALLTLRFKNAVVASLQLSRVAAGIPNRLTLEVFGSQGHAAFDSTRSDEYSLYISGDAEAIDGPRRVIAGPALPYYSDVSPMRARGTGTGYGEAFLAEIQEFISSVADSTPIDTSFSATVHSMRVIDAALASARTGSTISVSDV